MLSFRDWVLESLLKLNGAVGAWVEGQARLVGSWDAAFGS